MSDRDYDLLIIGSGPGGYVSAIRASQLGMKAGIVERDKPGGVCLNIGCIPSKALIHQAEVFRSAASLEAMGVAVDASGFDYRKVYKASRSAADRLSKGVAHLLKKNKVDLLSGTGKPVGPHEVSVDGKTYSADNILLATGSRPRSIPGFEIDEKKVLSSTGALMLEKLPKSIVILGGGAIGAEFAHIFNSFGSKVTLVEMLPGILPLEDPEAAAVLDKDFRGRGIEVYTGTSARGVKSVKSGVKVELSPPEEEEEAISLNAEKLLVAVGRQPNTEELGLEDLGIKMEKGYVRTRDYYQTDVSSIYAIGDIIPTVQLAHAASGEGEIAVSHMAGRSVPPKLDPTLIPSAVYTEPQVASFGYKLQEALDAGYKAEKGSFPYRGAGKAVAVEKSGGFVTVVRDGATGEVLGASAVGAEATELIHELLLARRSELLTEDISEMVHAHPTLSEAVMEAARAAEGWAVHI